MKVDILGCRVDAVTMAQAVERVAGWIESGRRDRGHAGPAQIVTLNAEMAYLGFRDAAFRRVVNGAALVTPDGSGILWAARRLGAPLKERVTGIDLVLELVQAAAAKGWRLYFYGAAPGVAETAAARLVAAHPGLEVAGTAHGYLDEAGQRELVADIRARRPDLLFVALGAPRQELWLARHLPELQVPVAMGVGGSFDVLAGRVKRAPGAWQRLKLEWLYRIIQEPGRWRRALALPRFILAVLAGKDGADGRDGR